MSFLKSLQNGWHFIVNDAEKEGVVFAHALIQSIQQNGGKVLQDAAIAGVAGAETVPGGAEAKLAAAFASVVAILTAEGIPVVKNAVHGAIEAALASQRATVPVEEPVA